jgi:hypothetical protein
MNSLKNIIENNFPIYECVLPFCKKTVKFNPFKVKDAKNISLILSENSKKISLNGMIDLLKSNSKGINVYDLCLADAEYLFLCMRAKSVGETINLILNKKTISINIQDIKFKNSLNEKTIKINENFYIEIKTPTIELLSKTNIDDKIDYIKCFISKITVKNEIFDFKKFVPEDIKESLENLPLSFLNEMEKEFKLQPELYINIDTEEGEREVSGILSFFTYP